MNEKVYVVHSECIAHGIIFNSRTRYVKDKEKAIRIYNETLRQMKEDNADILADKENYSIDKGGQRANKYFRCSYKYQPEISGFFVEISAEVLE